MSRAGTWYSSQVGGEISGAADLFSYGLEPTASHSILFIFTGIKIFSK